MLDDDLRYTGLVLQLVGVALAAYGISEVRRQWTQLPGLPGTVRALLRRTGDWIRHRILRHPRSIQLTGALAETSVTASAGIAFGTAGPPSEADLANRVAWLEQRTTALSEELAHAADAVRKERDEREAGDAAERHAWTTAVDDARRAPANFAGGGLRLQAWGVVCLLVGITLATIPGEIAGWLT